MEVGSNKVQKASKTGSNARFVLLSPHSANFPQAGEVKKDCALHFSRLR
jgi:hypothetical protein